MRKGRNSLPFSQSLRQMANEFVARKGIKILTISSGSTSNQVVVWNPTTNNLETRTDVGTSSGSVDASGFTGTPLAQIGRAHV